MAAANSLSENNSGHLKKKIHTLIVLYVSDADCFALCVKHCLFGIQIGKNKIKPYLQALGGPSLPFSAFCQWDEKQSQ